MRDGQAISEESGEQDVSRPVLFQPRFRLGEVYLTEEFIANCKIGKNTFESWVESGLTVYQDSTKSRYVLTDDVLHHWQRSKSAK